MTYCVVTLSEQDYTYTVTLPGIPVTFDCTDVTLSYAILLDQLNVLIVAILIYIYPPHGNAGTALLVV